MIAMSKLPKDIIVDILTYLPVKSLMRFKCVSKSWCSLISDPQFAKLHLKRANESGNNINCQRLLVATRPLYSVDFEAARDGDYDKAVAKLPYPSSVSGDSFAVGLFLGSCNGLVCILNEDDDMVLWNPSTRESKELPNCPKPSSSLNQGTVFTALGYDSSVDDYKIVIVSSTPGNGSAINMVEVFTMRTNRWRRIDQDIQHSSIYLGGRSAGVFWKGAVHWLGGKREPDGHHDLDVIVSFDLGEEKFMEKVVPLPNRFCEAVLSLSGNCLCCFGEVNPGAGSSFEAWITSGEHAGRGGCDVETVSWSWRRLFGIPMEKVRMDCYSTEMWLTKKGEVLVDHIGCPGLVELVHPVESRGKMIRLVHDSDPFYVSAIYTQSLVSLRLVENK